MGFIKLDRKILNWEWYKNKNTRLVFLHLLLTANYESGEWRGIKYGVGECLTSLPKLATECSLTIQQVRTALSNMKLTGEITERIVCKCRIITINNWSLYQGDNRINNRKITGNQQDNQQEDNRETNSSLRNKEIKNKENNINAFQKPTLEEVRTYCQERNNNVDPETFVDFYESKNWMIGKNKMKDWKAAVRTWERHEKESPKKNKFNNFKSRIYDFKELESDVYGM